MKKRRGTDQVGAVQMAPNIHRTELILLFENFGFLEKNCRVQYQEFLSKVFRRKIFSQKGFSKTYPLRRNTKWTKIGVVFAVSKRGIAKISGTYTSKIFRAFKRALRKYEIFILIFFGFRLLWGHNEIFW